MSLPDDRSPPHRVFPKCVIAMMERRYKVLGKRRRSSASRSQQKDDAIEGSIDALLKGVEKNKVSESTPQPYLNAIANSGEINAHRKSAAQYKALETAADFVASSDPWNLRHLLAGAVFAWVSRGGFEVLFDRKGRGRRIKDLAVEESTSPSSLTRSLKKLDKRFRDSAPDFLRFIEEHLSEKGVSLLTIQEILAHAAKNFGIH